jgi:hypothetical protein
MRRALPAFFVFALALALAIPATAATPSPKQMEAQIRTLQKQVKTLQKQVKTLTRSTNLAGGLALVALTYDACETAVTADALQAAQPTTFGSTPVTEYSPITNTGTACGDLGRVTGKTVARQPNTATVNVFQTLLNIFKP